MDGVDGLLFAHGHDHPFAGGQPIGLDHDRGTLFLYIGNGRFDLGEIAVGPGGNLVAGQEVLGEGLGPLQLRGALAGAETAQPLGGEFIHNAGHQGGLGPDNRQADLGLFGEMDQ